MHTQDSLSARPFLRRPELLLLLVLACVIALRFGVYQWMRTHGYFYGIPWDSFSRTLISHSWSKDPFFSPPDGYWLPLQFWLVGSVFALIRPWLPASEILVPVFINNLFFVGSIVALFFLTLKISNKPVVAISACLLASVFAGDVFVSYSALSEPMLIFFMLLASYLFYNMHTDEKEKHAVNAIRVSLIVLLAAATHYIGWFLAVFFCLYLLPYAISSFRQKDIQQTVQYGVAIIICGFFPILWSLNNLVQHGSLFLSVQTAKDLQEKFIGKMNWMDRFLIPPGVMLREFFPIVVPGLIAIIIILFHRRVKSLVYLLPVGFVFVLIWISTLFAFSAPYQEPRYLVVFGWILLPMIVLGLYFLWNEGVELGKIAAGLMLGFLIIFNVWQIQAFRNYFDSDVSTVAYQARNWFSSHPDKAQIFLVDIPSGENDVFRLISGHPERVQAISTDQMNSEIEKLEALLNNHRDPALYITSDKPLARLAKDQGLTVKRVGRFHLIFADD
jgi:hypothetical protein